MMPTRLHPKSMLACLCCLIGIAGCHHQFSGKEGGRVLSGLHVLDLSCEFQGEPMAIDAQRPRLSWRIESDVRGTMQGAYRVQVGSSVAALEDGPDLWDSGSVESGASVLVPYGGEDLDGGQRVFWRVRVWDEAGNAGDWSEVSSWTMAPDKEDWKAHWIAPSERVAVETAETERWVEAGAADTVFSWLGLEDKPEGMTPKAYAMEKLRGLPPAPLFRREFAVEGEIERAVLRYSGLGYGRAHLNGEDVSPGLLGPRQSQYEKWVFYETVDVTERLREGKNALGMRVGRGWWAEQLAFGNDWHDRDIMDTRARMDATLAGDKHMRVIERPDSPFGPGEPLMILQLEIEYADGRRETVVSDERWEWGTGAVLKDSTFAGELYDARREATDWDRPGFEGDWKGAVAVESPTEELRPQTVPPERALTEFEPVGRTHPAPGVYVFEFPRVFAGYARLRVEAPRGTAIGMRFGSQLDEAGRVVGIADGLVTAGSEMHDVYVCKGEGLEVWEPSFTYHGGKYVEVTGYPGEPPMDLLTGVSVRTEREVDGWFESSDPVLNKVHDAIRWTLASNVHGTVNAMSTRERDQWPVQALFNGRNFIYNFDMRRVWLETIRDLHGNTNEDGIPYDITPGYRKFGPLTYTTTAVVLLPWLYYTHYGDATVLRDNYALMRKAMRLSKQAYGDPPGSSLLMGLGDHCDPENEAKKVPSDHIGMSHHTHSTLVSSAIYLRALDALVEIAPLVGHPEDAVEYAAEAQRVREQLGARFYDEAAESFGSQCGDAMALDDGFAPESKRQEVLDSLIADIEYREGHLNTGFFGTPAMVHALCENGAAEVAFGVMTKTSYPSFGYYLTELGGNEVWEYWKDNFYGGTPFIGRLQTEKGGVGEWVYRDLAGIGADAQHPGFKHCLLSPRVPEGLEWIRCRFRSNYGWIESSWKQTESGLIWTVEVPPNSWATLRAPLEGEVALVETDSESEDIEGITAAGFGADGHARYRAQPGRYELHLTTR